MLSIWKKKGGRFMQNALTRHLAALALTLGLLITVVPAHAEPVATVARPQGHSVLP